jgi:predicted dehydrogenase
MKRTLRWGIIGTGIIARTFAEQLPFSKTGQLAAVGSRDLANAQAFAKKYGAKRVHGSYEALLADDTVEAIYLTTPHPLHAEWAIAAAKAGKHILCEKPITMTVAETRKVIAAARRHGVFLMEAFMYRCHPQTQRIAALIRAGAIGTPRRIETSFSFYSPFDPQHRHYKKALGGGGILDVGCYVMSVSRLVAGAAKGLPFENPEFISGRALLAPTGVDYAAAALLQFPGGLLAQVSCGVGLQCEKYLRVYGDEGWLHVPNFWVPPTQIELHLHNQTPRVIAPKTWPQHLYACEADAVAAALPAVESPFMSWDDTLGNMQALETWLKQSGVSYQRP